MGTRREWCYDRAPATRIAALTLASVWSFPFFATVDLWVALPPGNPYFASSYDLEAGWGLFFTSFVTIPLLILVVRPSLAGAVAHQIVVVGICTLIAAILSTDSLILIPVTVLFATAMLPRWLFSKRLAGRTANPLLMLIIWSGLSVIIFAVLPWVVYMLDLDGSIVSSGALTAGVLLLSILACAAYLAMTVRSLRADRRLQLDRSTVPFLVVSITGLLPWALYALFMSAHARTDQPYETNGIDHWPIQTALGLALALVPVAAALGWGHPQLSGWAAGIAGGGYGALCLLHPGLPASLGHAWAVGALVWGPMLVIAAEYATRKAATQCHANPEKA